MSKTRYSIGGELGKGGFGVVYLLKGDNGQKVRQTLQRVVMVGSSVPDIFLKQQQTFYSGLRQS